MANQKMNTSNTEVVKKGNVRVTISNSNVHLLDRWKNELIERNLWDGSNPPDYREVRIPIDVYFDMAEKIN